MLCPISGGNWNNAANAGVWALNLNNTRADSNNNYGFRADSGLLRTRQRDGRSEGDAFPRACTAAKSGCRRLSGSGFAAKVR
jgi:hypothetical protein